MMVSGILRIGDVRLNTRGPLPQSSGYTPQIPDAFPSSQNATLGVLTAGEGVIIIREGLGDVFVQKQPRTYATSESAKGRRPRKHPPKWPRKASVHFCSGLGFRVYPKAPYM